MGVDMGDRKKDGQGDDGGDTSAPDSMQKEATIEKLKCAIRKFKEAAAEAQELGLFGDDRELVSCPRCGLMEDVLIDGLLVTSWKGCTGTDTGLRFIEDQQVKDKFVCPACGCDAVPDEFDWSVQEF